MMLQAATGDRLSFDPLPLAQDGGAATEVDVGGGEVAEALVIAGMVVVLDEAPDLRLQIAGQVIVFEQDAVLGRLMPAFDLALRLGMIRRAADMRHAPAVEPAGQLLRDV